MWAAVLIGAALAGCADGGPSAEPPPIELAARWSDEVACADPEARAERAFDRYEGPGWTGRASTGGAYGLAAADLDGDGWIDLVVPGRDAVQLFWGAPGPRFVPGALPPVTAAAFRAASIADADGDGDLDVFLGSRDVPDLVLRSDGGRAFSVGFAFDGPRTMGSSWGDVDRDGDLDLAIANGADDDAPPLWLNRGDGTFEARSDLLPESFPIGDAFNVPIVDLDQDGWPDLYRANDTVGGPGNLVAWNTGGAFVADDGGAGLNDDICSMGVGIADLDGDELPDLAVSDCVDLVLHVSSGDRRWVDFSAALGFAIDPPALREVPWGVDLADLDNDGDIDGWVGYGFVSDDDWIMAREQLDGIYVQGADGTFVEDAERWGVTELTQSRGAVLADLNGDGWLDLLRQNLLSSPDLYLSRCGAEAWLRIALHEPGGNPFAIGAKVVVDDGERRQVRWVTAGGTSEASGGPPEVHFGLGGHEGPVDVEVVFPDGAVGRSASLPTRRRVVLTR